MTKTGVLLKGVVSNIFVDREDMQCPSRYLLVRVYNTQLALRTAGLAHNRRVKAAPPEDRFADTVGMFQPSLLREFIYKDGSREDRTGRCIGVIRLIAHRLSSDIIAHESIHASLHAWRMHRWAVEGDDLVDLGDNCGPAEERFAYLAGAITHEVVTATAKLAAQHRADLTTV